ncbi:hypothetical protein C1645_733402 [Glomus cerebriforme]|uniref:Uncharacterized protein n=1 Tax=Glomus cerebriforme TaxID=658196 RepID=A0A397TDG1_9GLOM|nr:hypothetical protein C1645_733402 [Glomus cerebriforme]
MAKVFSQQNNQNYWPYFIKEYYYNGQHFYIVIYYLSYEEGSKVLSEFFLPTVDMVLETCNIGAKRPPNSFIIFRTFLSKYIKYIPSSNVGKISQIATSIWKAASPNLKGAFKRLELNVSSTLRNSRPTSFIMHNDDNNNRSRRRRKKLSNSLNSSPYKKPSSDRQKYPDVPLNFNIITPNDFNEVVNDNEPPQPSTLTDNLIQHEHDKVVERIVNDESSQVPERHLLEFTNSNCRPPGFTYNSPTDSLVSPSPSGMESLLNEANKIPLFGYLTETDIANLNNLQFINGYNGFMLL